MSGQLPIELLEANPEIRIAEQWQGTEADKHDMLVIGRPQLLRV